LLGKRLAVKHRRSALTIVELLTVLGIMAMLVALLIPAVSAVQKTAKEAKQKAQFATLELGLTAFRNDYGDYPPSNWWDAPPAPVGPRDYCGAQKLAEALVGWDLMGFHPRSDFRANGYTDAGVFVYDPGDPILMDQRKGPYLELATASAFRVGDISPAKPGLFADTGVLAPDTFVLCDVFGVKKISMIKPGMFEATTYTAGTPILYYRANTSSKSLVPTGSPPNYEDQIYNPRDNFPLISLGRLVDWNKPLSAARGHILEDFAFYEYIRDPKITARPWPYRPDSYILISAGADGEYGTGDDICNFGQ
jgi:type II secretory pathway pseudopilin PulG